MTSNLTPAKDLQTGDQFRYLDRVYTVTGNATEGDSQMVSVEGHEYPMEFYPEWDVELVRSVAREQERAARAAAAAEIRELSKDIAAAEIRELSKDIARVQEYPHLNDHHDRLIIAINRDGDRIKRSYSTHLGWLRGQLRILQAGGWIHSAE